MGNVSRISDAIRLLNGFREIIDSGGESARRFMEMETALLDAQLSEAMIKKENLAMQNEILAMKHKIAQLDQLEAEKEHFEPQPLAEGAWAMVPKPGEHPDSQLAKPGMRLCIECFLNGKLSVLQRIDKRSSAMFVKCHSCGSEVMFEAPQRGFAEFSDGY